MVEFKESKFYKLLQDFFINNNKETFLQMLAEFYNRTEGILEKDNIQDELIKELRELYLEFNEKGIDENIVIEKVNYFVENNEKIKDILVKLVINANKIGNINSQLDTIATNEWCKGEFWNVCHKGGVLCCSPQNSLEGIEKANEYGYKAIEIDVQMSLDGQWVLFHDETVDFLTDGTGKLVDKTYSEIQQLNYDNTTGGNSTLLQNFYFPVKIPLFRDFLAKAKLFNMCVAIDVNGSRSYNEDDLLKLINIIKEFDMEKKIVIWGVDRDIVRKHSFHIALSVNPGSKLSADDAYNIAKPYLPNCIDNRIDINYDKSIIQGLHKYGIKCMTGFPGNGEQDTKETVDKWIKEYGLDYAVCDNYLIGGSM